MESLFEIKEDEPTDSYFEMVEEKTPTQDITRLPSDQTFFELIEEKQPVYKDELRNFARLGARSLETIAGLPGDISNFMDTITNSISSFVFPKEINEKTEEIKKDLFKIPGSKAIREKLTNEVFGDYLEPQDDWEQFSDDVIQDFTSLIVPLGGKMPMGRAILSALGGNLAGKMTKDLGFSESTGDKVKLGSMFFLSSVNPSGVKDYVKNIHQQARQSLGKDAFIPGKEITNQLQDFIKDLNKGGISPQKQPALSLAKQLLKKAKENPEKFTVDELLEFRTSVNDFRFNKDLTERGYSLLNRFDSILNNAIQDFGKTNPKFLDLYRQANLGTAGLKGSNRIAQNVSKFVKEGKVSPTTALMFGVHALGGGPSFLSKVGGGIATALGVRLINRVATNPVLRKYYLNALRGAADKNLAVFSRNANKLNEKLEETEK